MAMSIVQRVYSGFEVALVAVFLLAAATSMYWLVVFAFKSVTAESPEQFRTELIHLLDLAIYTLIFLDLARIMVASLSGRGFSLEGVMEVGMLALMREFIGLTAAEKPLHHVAATLAVFGVLLAAWVVVRKWREKTR